MFNLTHNKKSNKAEPQRNKNPHTYCVGKKLKIVTEFCIGKVGAEHIMSYIASLNAKWYKLYGEEFGIQENYKYFLTYF